MEWKRYRAARAIIYTSLFSSHLAFAHGGAHDHDPSVPALPEAVKAADIKASALQSMHDEYVARIEPIFRKKCFDCHSDRTEFPWYYKIPGIRHWIDSDIRQARDHIDMSGGFPFTSKHSIDHDLEEIAEEVSEGTMPPKAYVFVHAQTKLSEEDKKDVLNWVAKSRKALQESVAQPKH